MNKIYLCFDTETTGLPQNWKLNGMNTKTWSTARLIEIGCILFTIEDKQMKVIEKYSSLISYHMNDKEFEISGPIHKITNEMLTKDGKDVKEVLAKFKEMYKKADYILGHNVDFDVNVVLNEFNIANDNFRYTLLDEEYKKLCTCYYTFSIYNGKVSRQPRLCYIKLSKLFNIFFPDRSFESHRALNDAEVTAECFVKILFDN